MFIRCFRLSLILLGALCSAMAGCEWAIKLEPDPLKNPNAVLLPELIMVEKDRLAIGVNGVMGTVIGIYFDIVCTNLSDEDFEIKDDTCYLINSLDQKITLAAYKNSGNILLKSRKIVKGRLCVPNKIVPDDKTSHLDAFELVIVAQRIKDGKQITFDYQFH